ncbi:MAG: HEAT repeat domain-containing protein [Armatimonadota bacterium]
MSRRRKRLLVVGLLAAGVGGAALIRARFPTPARQPHTVADFAAVLGTPGPALERREAAMRLGRIGGRTAVAALAQALADDDASVRFAASAALAQVGAPAVPSLLEVLAHGSVDAREAAVLALAQIGDHRATGPLAKAVCNDGYSAVRAQAARALGRLGSPDSAEALTDALADADPAVRLAAVEALGVLPNSVAPDALAKACADEDEAVRERAREELARLAGKAKPAAPGKRLKRGQEE